MNPADGYASLARMLDYPEDKESILAALENVGEILAERERESVLAPFAGFVGRMTLAALQEEYVATFDFNPAVALYLGHHLYGDNQKKGAYLIRLKEEYGRHGYVPAGNELPDHLPMVLRFLAHLARRGSEDVRRSFISGCVTAGVQRLNAGFAGRADSPWKAVAEATAILCAADAAFREEATPC